MSTTTAVTKVRATKGKLAMNLEVGDVVLNIITATDGKPKVILETILEIVHNELGQENMTVITGWTFGENGDVHDSQLTFRRFDYLPVL